MDPASTPLLNVTGAEAMLLAALACMLGTVAWRTRERGMATLAAGFALSALWYALSDRIVDTGPVIETWPQRAGAFAIGSAVVLIATGVVQHIGWPTGLLRLCVAALVLPALLLLGALLAGIAVPHLVFHIGVLLAYVGAAAVALRRAAAEPGAGHLSMGLALLAIAAIPYALIAIGAHPQQLKYLAGAVLSVFGVFVLAEVLLQRHAAMLEENRRRAEAEAGLREANLRLEQRVNERTADLRELIVGLESFSRGVSHDLRGPLGGMAQLARQALDELAAGDGALARRVLPVIATQCDSLLRMVAAMLDLARMGVARARPERVPLQALAVSAFEEVMLGQGAAPRPEFRCDGLPVVMTDPDLLRVALVNLIGNAVKFSRGHAAPRVHIEARAEAADLVLAVSDNGVGFAPGEAARLFEPFYRAHGAAFDGHGLGLSIVRRAIEALGGQVWAEVAPEGGARLCLRLRAAWPAEVPAARQAEAEQQPG